MTEDEALERLVAIDERVTAAMLILGRLEEDPDVDRARQIQFLRVMTDEIGRRASELSTEIRLIGVRKA